MRWCLIALKSLCHFFLFGMCVLLLDVGWPCDKRTTKWSGFAVQWRKDEHWCRLVVWFWLLDEGGCLRFVFRSLSQIEVQEYLLRNVLKEAKILSKGWFWWLIRGTMRSLKVLRIAINSSQSVWFGWFICGFCWLAFHERAAWFLGIPKNYNNPLKSRGESYKGGLWFFVKLLKQSRREVDMCCLPIFMFCQVEGWCQEH